MKRIYVFFCFVLIITVTLQAQDSISSENKNIQMANQLYKQGQYADAARLYENELKKGVAAELYYNLGNSYYKSNEIGMAILNFERALRLDPDYEDARYNLKIAESKIVDNVNSTPTFFVKRLFNALITSNTSNHWTVISFVCFIVALVLFFFFVFSRNRRNRKYGFFGMFLFAGLFVTALIFSGIRKDQFLNRNEAIVMSGAVTAKSSPDKSGTDIFQLHEGTKVLVKSTLSGWTEITLENGAVGWVEESAIARI